MNPLGFVLLVGGLVLAAVGLLRARGPWSRYQALRAQEANVERYRAWRGGPAAPIADTTGADVMKALLRARVRQALLLAGAGALIALVGLALR